MKYLLLFFLLFSTGIVCQPERNNRPEKLQKPGKLNPTIHILPLSDSQVLLSYVYRIPHNRLIFERTGNSFKSSVRIQVEVFNDDELVKREYVDKEVSVEDFNIVKSKFASVQGIINFRLSDKGYTVRGVATDLNLQKEIAFETVDLDITPSLLTGIFQPIIIDSYEAACDGNTLPVCVIQAGAIPFSSRSYDLIFPITDATVTSIQVEVENNGEELFIKDVNEFFTGEIRTKECNGAIFIEKNEMGNNNRNFVLRGINNDLLEGRVVVRVKTIEEDDERKFPISVSWMNKPISLRNPEFAIEMLKYIDDESVLTEMLDADDKEYAGLLHQYWKQFDPTPSTEFNELMEEFYSRIDYAAMEFRGINKKNGLTTDRGKVYIKNGKPDTIERSSDDRGYVVEIWTYSAMKKIYQFVDKKGTGNFMLIEG